MRRDCILCERHAPSDELYARDGYALRRCSRCALVYLDPQPDADALSAAYYHDARFARALLGELRATTLLRAREKLAHLAGAGALRAGARVLDVGASSGAWLEVVAQAGCDRAVGVELGAGTAAAARERGLDVRTGTLAEVMPTLAGERFDLITFWDVLEHLPDPRRELALAGSLLAPGGRVAATFPNVAGLYPQLTYRLFARRTGVWEYPELPVHFYDFSPPTARALFATAGYEVETLRTYATPFDFYRATTLSAERVGRRLRCAFDLLHRVVYPIATLTDRGNAQFLLARAG